MVVYILRRAFQAIPLLVGLSIAGFVLLRLAPGGPMAVYAQNPSMTESDLRRIEHILGLDQPIHVQYLKWAAGMARGELGYSYRTGRAVGEVIRERVPATLELMGFAYLIAVSLGVTTGIVSAVKRHSLFDYGATAAAMVGRQALYLGMDKKPIVEKIYLGLAPEAESYVPPQSWAYNPRIKGRHKYDPEGAKRLLEEIGWKVGPDGIRVKDGARLSFENACTAGNKQRETIIIGMSMGSDPEHSFRLHSRYIPAKGGMGRNSIAYENPEVDRLLDAGVRDVDREKRKKAYFRLQELLADELPYLPIFHYVNIRGTRKGVQGFEPNANMQEYTWNPNEWWIQR